MASDVCCECGESMYQYAEGCFCSLQLVRQAQSEAEAVKDDGDARVLALLTAIGNPGECKKCGADVFFALHHSDRGENPKAGFAVKHKWRKWMTFNPDGDRHKCN